MPPPSPTPPSGSGTFKLDADTLKELANLIGAANQNNAAPSTNPTVPTSPTGPSGPLGGLSKLYSGIANTVVKIDNAYGAIQKKVIKVDTFAQAASEPLREMSLSIQESFGGFRRANQKMMIGVSQDMREGFDTFASVYTKTGDELIAAGRSQYVVEEYGKSVNLLKQVDISRQEYQEGFVNFIDTFKSTYGPALAKGLKDRMVDVKLFQENFGLTSDQLGKFVAKEIATTGKASGQMMDDLKKYSYGLSQQTGISAKIIASSTVSIVNNMEKFGNVTVEEAARMSTALAQLGVSYNQLEGMVGQFQGFDSAAQKVGELSAVFGVHLDAVEMMNLANTDQEAMMHKIRDAFNDSGQSLDDMNLAQKNLLKGQLGFTDMRQMEMFLSGQVDSLDDLKAKSEEAATDDMTAKSAANFNKDIATMTLAGKTAAQKFDRYSKDMAMSLNGIAPEVLTARLAVEEQMNGMNDSVSGIVAKTTNSIDKIRESFAKSYVSGKIGSGDVGKTILTEIEKGVKGTPAALEQAMTDGFTGIENVFYASILAPGSLSGLGLSILKGITGDDNATREGAASFVYLEDSFDLTIKSIASKVLPITSQISDIVAGSGLIDAIPAIENAGPLVTTTVSQVLQDYQSKLTEIQNLNDMPDMMNDLIQSLREISPNIKSIIDTVNALSETPMNITVNSGDKNGLQYALFEALKDYIHVDRGKFNISYVGE